MLITRKGGGVSSGENVGGPSTVLRCFGFAYAAPAPQDDKSPRRRLAITALFLLLILACHRTNIDRAQWHSMSANEKSLYVRTLLGHEKTKEAKGGNDRVFTRSINDYVKGIDDAYARGDTRNVDAIFESMGSPR
ncbi:MAG TPA: hypothetical protein VGQ21_01485 [Thermoanaerobaculia bacterium]|nr:hypothetical protein [Thermoanaerobaculia bacterium]